ncbi:MAG: (d)CMP kinase [Candidatus Marinimicrobia bacterium]|nr:(d)CMP kinase [Candidatus Neomarinimicrobiota bacterium]
MIIAIDGPAASGKSTTAKKVAHRLRFMYLDTGAMYRAVTLYFLHNKTSLSDPQEISNALNTINIHFTDNRIFMNDIDVTDDIRSNQINNLVSEVSAVSAIREKMVEWQRKIGEKQDIVIEGRDIGTHVFPGADHKFFIIADVLERARRRYDDLTGNMEDVSLDDVVSQLQTRDRKDSTRIFSPLRQAKDAILIDTTHLTIDEQVDAIIGIINQNKQKK